MKKRAAIYCRISRDSEGKGLGVERQRRDCAAYCKRQGWEVVEVYTDNDISAYSAKKKRPQYRAMLEAVRERRVDAIVTYHADRLHRSPRELEDFIDLIESSGCAVVTTSGGNYDLSTTDGRAMARVVGAFARKESEDKSRRLRRKHAELAEHGRPATHPGYGYRPDWTIDPEQAANVRDAAQRVLRGESCHAIARLWNEVGITTQRGRRWVQVSIGRTLRSPHLAGLRASHGEVVGPGTWKPILDRVTWERLQLVLRDPARRTNRVARRYLLTGLVFCHDCKVQMTALPNSQGTPRYVCRADHGGCYRTITAPDFEEWAVAVVLAVVQSKRFAKHARGAVQEDETAILREIEIDEQRLLEYADDLADRRISRAEWLRLREGVQRHLDGERARLSAISPAASAREFFPKGQTLEESWAELTFDERRAVLWGMLDRIEVKAGRRGRNFFDENRVIDTTFWKQ